MRKPANDRRRHGRAPTGYTAMVFAPRAPPLACTVENLAAGGALLCAALPPPADGPVRVRLQLGNRRDISLNAAVVRRHASAHGQHRFAVAFLAVPSMVQDLLQTAVLRALLATRAQAESATAPSPTPDS